MRARRQPVPHRHALVEDEAFAPPCAVLLGHFLQIAQDAAVEMVDLLHPFRLQESGGLFAADAAGAEHRHPALAGHQPLAMVAEPGREVGEPGRAGIHRARERADRHLIGVARVDRQRLGIGDQRVPRRRRDIGAGIGQRIDRDAHRHDLALHLHLQPVERHRRGVRELQRRRRAARQRADVREHRVQRRRRPRDRAVDPFAGQQQRALHPRRARARQQRFAQRVRVIEPREAVQRRDADRPRRAQWTKRATTSR